MLAIFVSDLIVAIQITERWRQIPSHLQEAKSLVLVGAALAFGGCGIWSTFFTLLLSMGLSSSPEEATNVTYDGILTICSLLWCFIFSAAHFHGASHDHFFEQSRMESVRRLLNSEISSMHEQPDPRAPSSGFDLNWQTALMERIHHVAGYGILAGLGMSAMVFVGFGVQLGCFHLGWRLDMMLASIWLSCGCAVLVVWVLFRVVRVVPGHNLPSHRKLAYVVSSS